jgi:hypothetical protein
MDITIAHTYRCGSDIARLREDFDKLCDFLHALGHALGHALEQDGVQLDVTAIVHLDVIANPPWLKSE